MTPNRYESQLKWVDKVIGQVMEEIATIARIRASKVIVMSDHNARGITPALQHEHVVFAVRDSLALEPHRVNLRVNAGDILRTELDLH
jgi:hypothetical protein